MALIEVNHSTLIDVADAIDAYCTAQDNEMKTANAAICKMLFNDWIGDDANAFFEKWNEVDKEGSATEQFKKMLKNYGDYLRFCAKEYAKAQEDAYNLAYRLPR